MARRVVAVVTDVLEGPQAVKEMSRDADGDGFELRVVVPAVEANAFQHTLGDIDAPRQQAEERLRHSLRALRDAGVEAEGEVGDPDPVQAAQDALLKAPADEVLIFEHETDQARWFEDGLFEHAQASLEPPLRMVVLHRGDAGGDKVVDVEHAARGTVDPDEGKEVGGAYLPGLSRGDFAGIVAGIAGTITAAVLAAVAAGGSGAESGWAAVAILLAIGVALINLAHVVGLTLMESVRYRGGFAKMFRTLSLVGTPIAVVVNALIAAFA